VIGGAAGIVVGFLVALVLSAFTPLPYAVAPWSIFAGLTVTMGAGVVFGLYPAIRASKLDPTQALRHE